MFLSVDGGHSRIFSSGTSWGPTVDVSYVDGGCSQITSSGTSQGARCALGSSAPAPMNKTLLKKIESLRC
jgi:hypothetical protein